VSVVRVELPVHLRTLARLERELRVEVAGTPTISAILDVLEAEHPMLKGTIRHHRNGPRRAYIRYFACGKDLSFHDADAPLPDAVAAGEEPFCVLGAIAGG
jgi:sulfur-carrier protein